MRFGVHLPLADLGGGIPDGAGLRDYTRVAVDLGFDMVSANDHLLWRRPWLDGLTALAGVVGETRGASLATSVALPTVRHPVVLAKALASLAVVTDGPVVAGLGPGSSAADHAAVGVPFEERWARFDESLRLVRALVRGERAPEGRYYPVGDLELAPLPAEPPQVWSGSWGSDARLRRLAEVADGWLASGYNTTPDRFVEARRRLDDHLADVGRNPAHFPDLIATMWLYVDDRPEPTRRILEEVLGPILGRDPAELHRQLPVGSPEHCIALLDAYAQIGAQRILLWPVDDPTGQLERFVQEVLPHVGASSPGQ